MSSIDLGLQMETKREDGTGHVATGYIQKRQEGYTGLGVLHTYSFLEKYCGVIKKSNASI